MLRMTSTTTFSAYGEATCYEHGSRLVATCLGR